MLPRVILPLAMAAAFSLSGIATAAGVEVNWNDPGSYSDIRHASSDSKKTFEERVFTQLEGHIAKLAKALPEEQKLIVDFTDVDLAGNVVPVRGADLIRVVKGNRSPARLTFDYSLSDASGNVLKQGSESLKSSTGTVQTAKSESFGIETRMLTNWFNETLI